MDTLLPLNLDVENNPLLFPWRRVGFPILGVFTMGILAAIWGLIEKLGWDFWVVDTDQRATPERQPKNARERRALRRNPTAYHRRFEHDHESPPRL